MSKHYNKLSKQASRAVKRLAGSQPKAWLDLMQEMERLRQQERDLLETTEDYRYSQGRCDILRFIVSFEAIADKVIESLDNRKDTSNIYN